MVSRACSYHCNQYISGDVRDQMLYPRPLIPEFKPPTTPQKMLAPLLPFFWWGGIGITCSCSACSNHCNHYTGGGVRDSSYHYNQYTSGDVRDKMLYPRPLIPEFKPPTTPQKMLAPLLPFGGGGGRYHIFMQRVLKPLQSIHRGGWGGGTGITCSCSACSCHYNHYTRGGGGGGCS